MRIATWLRVGMIALVPLLIHSCFKDNQPLITEPQTPELPQDQEIIPTENTLDKRWNHLESPIGFYELENVVQSKSLIRELIKESFLQLMLNHDFNPLMPYIDTRMPCTPPCTLTDCGCPYQSPAANPNPSDYPKTITLKYYNPSDCGNCTLMGSGLEVYGEMILVFSESFATPQHEISIFPQDNFTVDGFDIDADSIKLKHVINTSDAVGIYEFESLANVEIINPAGDTTKSNQIDDKSILFIEDVNENHGDIANAFGLLDDIFTLHIVDLEVQCSNGEIVLENSSSPLVYDMDCSCIQDGIVVVSPGPNLPPIATYDYGYVGSGNYGTCDDLIELTIPCLNIKENTQADTRSTSEIINCL